MIMPGSAWKHKYNQDVLLQSSSNQYLIIDKCSKIRASRGFPLGAFLHAEIMKMSVSGAKTVPKSGKSYEDLCFAMFA